MSRIKKLREFPCAIQDDPGWEPGGDWECSPDLDIHHRTGAGMALKADDEKTFPLCHRHHMDFHQQRGLFRLWSKEAKHRWQDEMIERYDRILSDPEAF